MSKMNFSPYQPSPDEDRSSRTPKQSSNTNNNTPSTSQYSSYQAGSSASYAEPSTFSSFNPQSNSSQSVRVNKYETTLPIRVDIEAALAYVLGPLTGKTMASLNDK
ncbi:hypothetical protein K501DRAFT_310719 [Backusella circina FSU 941]|nr:hypothetical protein K501DRAFT_310719 [Backusella circina FSU 941]